ncbi:MAG: contact-dependent growth inhibition system immunity protein [Gemmatimonadota bacterium]|nr:contact-dependent growth inhibition system immunity protein [Gemmatimonadota bacterium]
MSSRREQARANPIPTRCLDDLLGPAEGSRGSARPSRAAREARRVPLQQLRPAQLLTLLHEGIGLAYILPFAVDAAARDPWARVEFHPGDLLLAVLSTDPTHWRPGTRTRQQMVLLAKSAHRKLAGMPQANRSPATEKDLVAWLAALKLKGGER